MNKEKRGNIKPNILLAEAEKKFNNLDEKYKNMWLFDAKQSLYGQERKNIHTHRAIKNLALELFYLTSSKRPLISKARRKVYEKLSDSVRTAYENDVLIMLKSEGENPACYPVSEMALSRWDEETYRKEVERKFFAHEYPKMSADEKVQFKNEARMLLEEENEEVDPSRLRFWAHDLWLQR